ncbi:alpha/beta fold hydrolase [Streptomonospora nanhaiensis]|uniref:alpha/beta fold hydrolase n=1 Tax=Streptomonospora nanhaiensis TaxID=1323731 RepID=UPI001C995CE7|nr:alpha/beta hydrolase [Streptomonospora nanhaiensis]MBX9386937.1 alpha/beta hydrolase [Streptomonospora nanhaiensis]
MSIRIPGFDEQTVRVGEVDLHVALGGDGHPVLLLHGFPQTHLTWRHVAPALADRFHVVCPDLPGYGASGRPADGPEQYSKRATAATVVGLMRVLGHDRFSLIGHDRGALVAFRAALDHPAAIDHLGVIDVIPTVDMWASLNGVGGVFAFHLYLLAQPNDLPERMINADPDTFFGHFFDTWATDPATIPSEVRDAYLRAARAPEAIHAICQDYRASAFIDAAHDAEDRQGGKRVQAPTLAIWQDPGDLVLPFDPQAIWRDWTAELRTLVLAGGHFLPEAQPSAVTAAIRDLIT